MKKNNHKYAFTLAEVLITLMILGVIATITIPQLIQKWQEKALVGQLKSTFSILSRAFNMSVTENGNITEWDISSSTNLYNYFKPYLRISKDCGTSTSGCFATHYGALFNQNSSTYPAHGNSKNIILSNGTSIAFLSFGKCALRTQYIGAGLIECGEISVDINGQNGPNVAGKDFFVINIYPNNTLGGYNLYTKGAQDQSGRFCKYNDTSSTNGAVCTYYVLKYGNMDYLRRDVTNDK